MTTDLATPDLSDLSAWSEPIEMIPGPEGEAGRGSVRTEQIILPDGTWLAGGSTEATKLDAVKEIRAKAKAASVSTSIIQLCACDV